MKNIWLVLAACLPLAAAAESISLSGKVTDKSGHGIAGIWVGLQKSMIATLTANDGSWSLNGNTGVAPRSTRSIPVTRHLLREGGRLRVSFAGSDAFGRNLSGTESVRSLAGNHTAARAVAEVFDTLLYVRGDRLLASSPVSSSSFPFGAAALDTSSIQSLTKHGDSIQFIYTAYVDISCSSQNLSVWKYGPDTSKYLFRTTPEGFEMVYVGRGSSLDFYPTAAKFRRLSGTPGSVVGRFQYLGVVYRPTIANVPDSTKRIISEDSARSERTLAKLSPIYEFTETSFFPVSMNTPSFAREFLNNWSYADEGRYYSSYDSTWLDERRYSDSAHYDISVQIVDSSTVRMTGAKTGEIVTLHGSPVVSGFDRTYTSSDATHATGTRLAVATSCPEAASWYESFRSAHYRSTILSAAARRFDSGSTPTPPAPHPFLLLRRGR